MSKNPFEAHGLPHLSPSTCNMFAASPAAFIMKILKVAGKVGAAAHRGTSVEDGVSHGLFNPGVPVADCIGVAEQKFWSLTALSGDPNTEKERQSIAPMVTRALGELRAYGPPTSAQGKVEHYVDGLAVPLIGFYDLEWANHGTVLDLKTTHRLPSKISVPHARQVSLYAHCRGTKHDARLAYVTTQKASIYRLENVDEHLKALERIALTIQRFLSISSDAKELAALVVPDVDSFYFNDTFTRQKCHEIWGI